MSQKAAYELVTKQLPGEGVGQIIALIDVGAAPGVEHVLAAKSGGEGLAVVA